MIQSDYTESEWEHISKIRKENGWELPLDHVMNQLILNRGYHDSLQLALKIKFYNEIYLEEKTNKNKMKYEELNKKIDLIKWKQYEKYKDELDLDLCKAFFEWFKKHWQYTSRYDTRIDYVLLSHDLKNSLSDYGFKDTMSAVKEGQCLTDGLTDHNLYWCDINI